MVRSEIEDLPPSAKLVVTVLEREGPLTQQQLADATMLSPRTVRDALGRLRERNAIEEEMLLRDARKKLYRLDHMASRE